MMRLARRLSLLALFCILMSSAVTSYAECECVLWAGAERNPRPLIGDSIQSTPVERYGAKRECLETLNLTAKNPKNRGGSFDASPTLSTRAGRRGAGAPRIFLAHHFRCGEGDGERRRVRSTRPEAIADAIALFEGLALEAPDQQPSEDLPRPRNILFQEPAALGHVSPPLEPEPFDVQAGRVQGPGSSLEPGAAGAASIDGLEDEHRDLREAFELRGSVRAARR
jgi:hypothetical protein